MSEEVEMNPGDKVRVHGIKGGENMKRCFAIGRGASLKGFDFSILDGEYKIAVNHFVGNPDAVVFLDHVFAVIYRDELDGFSGEIYCGENINYQGSRVHYLPYRKGARNRLSGIAAIEVGLSIADKVYLLGYDFGSLYNMTHFDDTNNPVYENSKWRQRRMRVFSQFPKDRVFNCSPSSNINCFDYVDIKSV